MDKSRKTLSRPSRRKFSYKKNQVIPSKVKVSTLATNMDSTESSFGKPEESISRPGEKGITIREPLLQNHSKVQADTEA